MGDVLNQSPYKTGASLTHTGLTATFTTNLPHGLVIGQGVVISDTKVGGVLSTIYNGSFEITEVPSATQFKYAMTQDPMLDPDSSPIPQFGALWQVGRQLIENNIIELVPSFFANPDSYYPGGVVISGRAHVSPYVFGDVVVRRNIIRTVDNAVDPSGYSVGITFTSCENAIIEDNIVNLNSAAKIPPYNIAGAFIGSLKFFNNQTPGGRLIPGYNSNLEETLNELATDAEFAFLNSS